MRTSQDLILDHYHKELRNMKNNIFLIKLASSTPKFSEDQIKPQVAPLIKSQKIEGVLGTGTFWLQSTHA